MVFIKILNSMFSNTLQPQSGDFNSYLTSEKTRKRITKQPKTKNLQKNSSSPVTKKIKKPRNSKKNIPDIEIQRKSDLEQKNQKFLCLKIETTGLIDRHESGGFRSFKNLQAHENCRLICLSYAVFDKISGERSLQKKILIKPDVFSLIDEVNQIHHISIEDINSGISTKAAFEIFLEDLTKVDVFYVYCKAFYQNVLKSEIYRMEDRKMMNKFGKTKMVCLAKLCAEELFGARHKFAEAFELLMGTKIENENFLENMKERIMKLKIFE